MDIARATKNERMRPGQVNDFKKLFGQDMTSESKTRRSQGLHFRATRRSPLDVDCTSVMSDSIPACLLPPSGKDLNDLERLVGPVKYPRRCDVYLLWQTAKLRSYL